MASDNVLKAAEIINRYPEVFESLLEFERTKKIPKLYRRKKLNITIDENILKEFKRYSLEKGINISRFVERKMTDEIKTAK